MNNFSQPNPGFIIVVNNDGDVVDFDSVNSDLDQVGDLVAYLNINFPNKSPHSAWKCNGSFEKVDLK